VKSLQKEQNSRNLLLWTPICRNKLAITPKWFNSLDTNSSSLAIVTFLFLSIIDLQTINASFWWNTCCHSTNFFDAPAFSYTKLCKRQTKNSSNHRIFTKTHGNDQYCEFWTIAIIFMQWKLRNITNYTQFLFIMSINGMTIITKAFFIIHTVSLFTSAMHNIHI
jgi:hypothetical protein